MSQIYFNIDEGTCRTKKNKGNKKKPRNLPETFIAISFQSFDFHYSKENKKY